MSRRHVHRNPARPLCRERGFTLIELVVVIVIVGVLAAVAVPRFIALGRDARIASLTTMASTLWTTAINVRAACKLNPACDHGNYNQTVTVSGRQAPAELRLAECGRQPERRPDRRVGHHAGLHRQHPAVRPDPVRGRWRAGPGELRGDLCRSHLQPGARADDHAGDQRLLTHAVPVHHIALNRCT